MEDCGACLREEGHVDVNGGGVAARETEGAVGVLDVVLVERGAGWGWEV